MRSKYGEPLRWLKAQLLVTDDECRLWPFGLSHGYGTVRALGRTWNAHRLLCIMAHGQPKVYETDASHSCGNRLCCNPNHLRHATAESNQHDKFAHGTIVRGVAQAKAKLTDEKVRSIKAQIGQRSLRSIADDYGVSTNAIWLIKNGRNWAHV